MAEAALSRKRIPDGGALRRRALRLVTVLFRMPRYYHGCACLSGEVVLPDPPPLLLVSLRRGVMLYRHVFSQEERPRGPHPPPSAVALIDS